MGDLENKKLFDVFQIDTGIRLLSFSPDQNYLALADDESQIQVLEKNDEIKDDDEDNDAAKYFSDLYSLKIILSGHSSHVTHLDWSQDSKHMRY